MLRTLPVTGARLQVVAAGPRESAWLEFSAPKVLGGDNVEPASIGQLEQAVSPALAEAGEFVELDADELRVNRLDIARDFDGVDELGVLLLGLSGVPVAGAKSRNVYRAPELGHAQTLFVRNGGGGARLYDKSEEAGLAVPGRLRFEAQERRDALRAQGVERLADLTDDQLLATARARMRWAGMDRSVSSGAAAAARILDADLTDGQRLQALGGLYAAQLGQWDAIGNRDRRGRVRRWLTAADAHTCCEAEGQAFTMRLDLVEGFQKLAA